MLGLYIALLLYGSWVLLPHQRYEEVESIRFLMWLTLLLICFLSLLIIVWTTGGKPSRKAEDDRS